MVKIVTLRALDCRFHDKNFFLNMQDVISQEYVLQTLLGPSRGSNYSNNRAIGVELKWIFQATFSKMLLLGSARLHTICDALKKSNSIDEDQVVNDISLVFKNLTNNELRDINETDLLRVMKDEDLANVLQLFDGASKTKRISEASLRNWMFKVYNERKHVVHSLNNTSNVIEQLDKIVSVNLSILVALGWCLLMGFGTTKFLVFISSHLLLLVYFFGDYCKMICEGFLLAIVLHPFDLGNHCIIDNEQLMVEDIGLINTVFLKDSNEKVNCLNSVLLTKTISNLNRSSKLRATFELLFSSATSFETIEALKLKIDELLGSKPESWHAEHSFYLKGIDNVTHIYNLQISYATHFQNYKEMNYRRSELVLKLSKLLEELSIENFTIQ
ncbi:hypothetical protein POM88_045446 [Heracleum sosnowskyi]|uniref:Uncharacterized protein n=1 Tax=Heracleum sosnowskyi TaxID=360622 RepID=A0AAD8H7G4_9APIA|nr:hypothetical protein POM88_045446 [Heracleum sosnowskyi]